jgi:hypothetical protein
MTRIRFVRVDELGRSPSHGLRVFRESGNMLFNIHFRFEQRIPLCVAHTKATTQKP